jgi:hypothetical protein
LWRDQLRIGLAPDRLVLAAYRRGIRPVLAGKDLIAVEPSRSLGDWRPAVEALPAALARFPGNRAQVTVVLSNHFARYALLPWIPALRTDDEWLALARERLAIVHGQSAEEWTVLASETAHHGPRVACAVDRALLEALEEKIGGGATLVSVQPYLMAAYNRVRPAIEGESCWLVVAEPGRLTLALIQDGVWGAIRTRRADERWQAMLPDILERESAVLALDNACPQVIVHTQDTIDADAEGAFRIRDLTATADAGLDDRKFAMVLG